MVLFACLVLLKSSQILVEANERIFKALASFDGIRDGRPSYQQAAILDTGQILELFELAYKGILVFLSDFRLEFEHN